MAVQDRWVHYGGQQYVGKFDPDFPNTLTVENSEFVMLRAQMNIVIHAGATPVSATQTIRKIASVVRADGTDTITLEAL
jgi:hypothetical protein